jgi:hypothetical protein
MKSLIKVALVVVSLVPAFAFAQPGACDTKQQSIQDELTYAQSHHNSARIHGLQKALAESKAHCTDASLHNAAQEKIAKAQQNLADKQHDLQDAKDQHKSAKKIADRQRKVDSAHAELEQAMISAGKM